MDQNNLPGSSYPPWDVPIPDNGLDLPSTQEGDDIAAFAMARSLQQNDPGLHTNTAGSHSPQLSPELLPSEAEGAAQTTSGGSLEDCVIDLCESPQHTKKVSTELQISTTVGNCDNGTDDRNEQRSADQQRESMGSTSIPEPARPLNSNGKETSELNGGLYSSNATDEDVPDSGNGGDGMDKEVDESSDIVEVVENGSPAKSMSSSSISLSDDSGHEDALPTTPDAKQESDLETPNATLAVKRSNEVPIPSFSEEPPTKKLKQDSSGPPLMVSTEKEMHVSDVPSQPGTAPSVQIPEGAPVAGAQPSGNEKAPLVTEDAPESTMPASAAPVAAERMTPGGEGVSSEIAPPAPEKSEPVVELAPRVVSVETAPLVDQEKAAPAVGQAQKGSLSETSPPLGDQEKAAPKAAPEAAPEEQVALSAAAPPVVEDKAVPVVAPGQEHAPSAIAPAAAQEKLMPAAAPPPQVASSAIVRSATEEKAMQSVSLAAETAPSDTAPPAAQESVAPAEAPATQGSSSPSAPLVVSSATPSAEKGSAPATAVSANKEDDADKPLCDPTFAKLIKLEPLPNVAPLPLLSLREVAELELALQMGDKFNHCPDDNWRSDWSGNLQLVDKELIVNRDQLAQNPTAKPIKLPFCEVVAQSAKNSEGLRGLDLLFSYVYHMEGTPVMAKRIMAYSLRRPAKSAEERLSFILDAIRRISYDPNVLRQDGWTTVKAESPDGASGGAYLIGRRVIWQRYEAMVIAFVRDDEIGDLWKAMWLEDFDTFDLEADELQEAMRKWETKQARIVKRNKNLAGKTGSSAKPSASIRFAASSKFAVDGIEHGIILASSFNSKARMGVLWPARVMHVSEIKALGSQQVSRRSSSKNTIHVVFLAPYWNGQYSFSSKRGVDSISKAKDAFSTGPILEMDQVEVSASTIQKYPYGDDASESLSLDKLQSAFRFLGLPKAAFARYLDSHRLAMALKVYAKREVARSGSTGSDGSQANAFAALTDTHTLSVQTAMFPPVLLNLPFGYILEKLPHPAEHASQLVGDDGEEATEPVLHLHQILKAMSPPQCFGEKQIDGAVSGNAAQTSSVAALATPQSACPLTPVASPNAQFSSSVSKSDGNAGEGTDDPLWSLQNFASEYLLNLTGTGSDSDANISALACLGNHLATLVTRLRRTVAVAAAANETDKKQRTERLMEFQKHCLMIKGHGEEILFSDEIPTGLNRKNIVIEWRKACERIYKRAAAKFSSSGFGNGVTTVLTDSRCNQHITANGSYERAVRLPAAIRGAKQAGAGSNPNIALVYKIEDKYLELAEKKILPKAHKASYLKRMKEKVAALPPDAKGAPLTDDSDGEGGEDTMGSRGSYTAAVTGVAAALKAVDMVVGGECVNTFCAIRPPGHHAGRELRPMNAISNGFCLLNAAACAALYATAPQSEGGLGLRRVCVVDFDVHHGNGTQDVLCSTYDSRFLYVSVHAGGAHINGFEGEDSDSGNDVFRSLGGGQKEGIFPGRCGDTSPHEGVLNIPLGAKVTAADMGNALVSQVSPVVEAFAPELIILSAGFDAHKHDPLGMGGLSAEDFGSLTEVACQMAFRSCSGRVLSVLEGGYGVPCCRPRKDLFLPDRMHIGGLSQHAAPIKLLELGEDLPDSMEDEIPAVLQQKLDRCHAEGFLECVKEHVGSLARCSKRK